MISQATYRVVLADDVAALRRLVRLTIEASGRFTVEAEAANGVEAVEAARRLQPDLVLLDLSMPEMDGLEALPRVLSVAPRSRVAVFSGFNHVRMAPVALRMGASEYLEKGLQPTELVQRLLRILEPNAPAAESPASSGASLSIAPEAEHARVLVFEANPSLWGRFASQLEGVARFRGRTSEVHSLAEANEALAESHVDAVLVHPEDGSDAEPILVEILSRAADIPVVACVRDDEQAREASKLGVEDCVHVSKCDAGVLERSILYAMERRRNYSGRLAARAQARELERLRELEHAKSQFFNSAAHELGTPLTPIKLQLHLLKNMGEGEMNEGRQKALDILDRNVDRLSRLTQELLDVARLQAGHMQLEIEPTDLRKVVQEVVESFAPVAADRGVKLSADIREPLLVQADPKRLSQVLYNLVSNALKFTPRGGRVVIEETQSDKEVVMLVHDDGVGLSQEQISHLFQPFSQVHADKKSLGTGLGLFVSRGIVQLHGGRIWCESQGAGRGATFAFTLPRLVVAGPEVRGPSLRRSGGAVSQASGPG